MNDHQDFSFTCCFSPNETTLATGNQDKTTILYDIRNLSKPLHILGAKVGGVRSLHFSNDGKYLAMAGNNNNKKKEICTYQIWIYPYVSIKIYIFIIITINYLQIF